MNDYPEKLIQTVNKYLEENSGAKIFHYDDIISTPFKDKTVTQTTYRIYVLNLNYFKVYSYGVCSNPDYFSYDEVFCSGMVAWEIKMCMEKSGFFR